MGEPRKRDPDTRLENKWDIYSSRVQTSFPPLVYRHLVRHHLLGSDRGPTARVTVGVGGRVVSFEDPYLLREINRSRTS